jgi:hypothetical protein
LDTPKEDAQLQAVAIEANAAEAQPRKSGLHTD